MNAFTASNGVQIETQGAVLRAANPDGSNPAVAAVGIFVDALREFFQAEADERLGRWRWPKNPEYVVYAPVDFSHYVRVLNERDAMYEVVYRARRLDGRGSLMAQAARAYFDAHPEPKPWHEAVEGEVWALTLGDDTEPRGWMAEGDGPRFWRGGHSIDRLSGSISAGRRIWPEVSV